MSYELDKQDIFAFANYIGANTKVKGDELYFERCPMCNGSRDDKETFSINLESGAFNCFRASCGYHGHFVELCRDFDYDLDFGEARPYKQLPQKPIQTRNGAIEFLKKRGISERIVKKYNITTRLDNPNILVFPFYDEENVLRFIKYRNMKYQKGYGNKEWCEKDTMPILFGINRCVGKDRLIITEGQIDSLSVAEAGFDNAVSVPTGANGFTWLNFCWDFITSFKEVVVFGDNENGKITLFDTLQTRLPSQVLVKCVRRKDYLGEKDANAILCKYGVNAIKKAIDNAELPRLSNVKLLSEVEFVDIKSLPKLKTNIREVDRVIGGLAFGQLIILTGKCGSGKSTLMSQLAIEAVEQDQSVFVYSGELTDYHFKNWLNFQCAGRHNLQPYENEYGDTEYALPVTKAKQINDWYRNKIYIYDNSYIPEDKKEMEALPETIERVIKKYGVSFICVDNLMTAMEATDDNTLNSAQTNFVTELKRIAMRYNVIIILVAHQRKNSTNSGNDEVSGSANITNRADIVMGYARRAKKEGETTLGGSLSITKNRLTGNIAVGDEAIPLNFDYGSKRVYSGVYGDTRRYSWEARDNAGDNTIPDIYEEVIL